MKPMFFLLSLTLLGSVTLAEVPARVQNISKAFSDVLLGCPTRIWPNLNWSKHQILLVDSEAKKAWLWKGDGQVSEQDFESLDAPVKIAHYYFSQREQTKILSINLNSNPLEGESPLSDSAVEVAFHEGFHIFEQASPWPSFVKTNGERNEHYPVNYEPRYLKRMVLRSLLEALKSDYAHDAIENASYWQSLLKSRYAGELESAREADIAEGTAYYAQLVATALSLLGCQATEEELLSFLESKAEQIFNLEKPFFKAFESYDIGAVASLILRKLEFSEWQEKVINGKTPLEILLDGRRQRVQAENEEVRTKAQAQIGAINERLEIAIDPMLKEYRSKRFVRVSFPTLWGSGQIRHGGEYSAYGELPTIIEANGSFASPNDKTKVKLTEATLLEGISNPCGQELRTTILISKADIVSAKDKTTIETKSLQMSALKTRSTKDQEGFSWLCIDE